MESDNRISFISDIICILIILIFKIFCFSSILKNYIFLHSDNIFNTCSLALPQYVLQSRTPPPFFYNYLLFSFINFYAFALSIITMLLSQFPFLNNYLTTLCAHILIFVQTFGCFLFLFFLISRQICVCVEATSFYLSHVFLSFLLVVDNFYLLGLFHPFFIFDHDIYLSNTSLENFYLLPWITTL